MPRRVNATSVAMSANMRPRPNVVRPDAALHASANANQRDAGSVTGARNRLSRWAVSAAETVPVTTATVRIPNSAMRCGAMTL